MGNSTVDFYRPIKTMKLKTFSFMTKVAKFSVKDQVILMKVQSQLFRRLALIMQSRSADLKGVFSYDLGP